ncbi:MAG: hypothetical protein ACYTGN_11420 [Planctomycetota bacterium]|jgi:hypothetical protein
MGSLKRMVLLALAFAFIGGLGTGAWIGTLTAAPVNSGDPTIDDRVGEFERALDLDATQLRQLRSVLDAHDKAIDEIHRDITTEQFRRKLATEERTRRLIRALLRPGQEAEYDKRIGRG